VLGDGRLKLEDDPDSSYDAIVMDAFSSDSVPMHLLTVEAFELYLQKLRPDGVIAFNISNRYLDLEPVVAGIARRLELSGVAQHHRFPKAKYELTGIASSKWVVLARDTTILDPLRRDKRWRVLSTSADLPVWTDQSSNILDVTHLFGQ
jgi:spermidine synthase